MTSSTVVQPSDKIIAEVFVDPFLKTEFGPDGKQIFTFYKVTRDTVQDFILGKTSCILTEDGEPLPLDRQEAYMKKLEELGKMIETRSRKTYMLEELRKNFET